MEFTSRKLADVVVVVPVGAIDHPNAAKLEQALAPFVGNAAAGRVPVVLDFAGVDYISSMGLRVLLMASKSMRAGGAPMAVASLQPAVAEIFDIARFRFVVDVHPTLRDALAAVSPAAATAYDASPD